MVSVHGLGDDHVAVLCFVAIAVLLPPNRVVWLVSPFVGPEDGFDRLSAAGQRNVVWHSQGQQFQMVIQLPGIR